MFELSISKKTIIILGLAISLIIFLWLASSQVYDFFNEYFIKPLGHSYNPINSAVYALMLILGIFFISKKLSNFNVKINEKFCLATLPFILLGSCLRVYQDAEIVNTLLLVSPLIYFVIFLYSFISLIISLKISKRLRTDYHLLFFFFGLVPTILFLFPLIVHIVNLYSVILTLALSGMACFLAFLGFFGLNKIMTFDKFAFNLGVIFSHLLDVSATYIGVTFFSYGEQHFFIRSVNEVFGSIIIFYFIDYLAIILILLILEKILHDNQTLIGLFRLTLIVLGLAPALRDILRVALLV